MLNDYKLNKNNCNLLNYKYVRFIKLRYVNVMILSQQVLNIFG